MAGQRGKAKSKNGGWAKEGATSLQLPSGQVARVKRPGIQAFLKKGVIPDSLTPIIQTQLAKAQGKRTRETPETSLDPSALMADPSKIEAIMSLLDLVVLDVVVEPRVQARPTEPIGDKTVEEQVEELDAAGVFFPDEIDLDDKVFIFNYAVGGTRDLERFRERSAAGVGGVADGEGVPDSA